ncbi:hypothetical protein DFJ74DRAFT_438272 [Hyaloraphidium curvatum]|nr:hypothetical protein DFJ74DRAFT_438272 [Hyaloraphidium curvatum]
MAPVLTDLPPFKGWVVHRGDKIFDPSRYQYCYASQPEGKLDPAAIIYVEDVEDVKAAVKYAAAKGIAIAVRTGGHQYLGASSTNGDNIQIDLSGKSRKFNSYDKEKNIFKCGPGINVGG